MHFIPRFFYGHTEWAETRDWPLGILIHTLQLKLRHFEVSPYVCIGKPCMCNVFHPCATWAAGLRVHINVMTFTQFIQNWSIGCLLALYGSSSTMWRFLDNSLFCLVCGLLGEQKKYRLPATMHPARLCGGFRTIFSAKCVGSFENKLFK